MQSQVPRRPSSSVSLSFLSPGFSPEMHFLLEEREPWRKMSGPQLPANPFREALSTFPSPLPKPEFIPR